MTRRILCLGLSAAVAVLAQEPFFFIQMSDPQFGMYTADRSFEQETANLTFAVETANRLRPAFVVITGDLINKPGDAAQAAEYFRVTKRLDPSIPLYSVAGNHDVGNEPTPETLATYRRTFGKDYYSFRHGETAGIVLNSSLIAAPGKATEEAERQEKWLEEELQKLRSQNARRMLVFQHHPYFLKTADEPDQYFNIPRAARERYLGLLRSFGITHIFAGHYHRNEHGAAPGLEMITTGPVGKPLGPGGSGFRVVFVNPGGIQHKFHGFGDLPNRIELQEGENNMSLTRRQLISLPAGALAYAATADPVAPWKRAKTHPVSDVPNRHTIHSYFNVTPESPDGRHVLFYTSTTAEAHAGEIRIQERATGRETVLARNLDCEDAHRVACQQWVSHGRRILFHDMRNGEVVAAAVDIKTRQERVLAKGRMVSWGQPDSDWAPIYGTHFQPGPFKNVELLNVETGEIRTLVTGEQVRKAYPEQIRKLYGDKEISTPFGTLSPNGKLIFFKLSAADDKYVPLPEGHLKWPRSYQSDREGLVCFDIERSKLLFFRRDWGHPAWHPSSESFINVPNIMIDAHTGEERPIPNLPKFPGSHLSVSPDGKLFVTDTQLGPFGGAEGEWGVAVCDMRGGNWTMIARFQGAQGATTWRKNHPHPVFSPDGKRIYYNLNSGKYTQLFVAECGEARPVTDGE